MRRLVFIFNLIVLFNTVYAGLLPDYDENCDHLLKEKCPIEDFLSGEKKCNEPVPRKIHRIWFGCQNKLSNDNRKMWDDYAREFGYDYRLWTEADLEELSMFMGPRNFSYLKLFVSIENWWAASDIVRLELIKQFGGIYLDCDFSVPKFEGKNIDIMDLIDKTGLTLMCEHHAREVGSNNAIFVANGFIAAPRNHTMISFAVTYISNNIDEWLVNNENYNAMYATGPFYINRILNGTYRVIPVTFFEELGTL